MKVTTTILSLSLSAITILPAAASDVSSSDRASWIEQTLNSSNHTASKKTTTLSGRVSSNSITSTSGSSLSHSVAGLFPGVRMRPFVPNRYLPSEHDIELAQAQASGQTVASTQTIASAQTAASAPQLPASTVQLAKAMAQTQAMTIAQRQMQRGVAYTGGYTPAKPRMNSMQARMNTLDAAIPEPMSSNETIGQIRSTLRHNAQRGQLIASASTGNNGYNANLYPDIVSPVPTQATINAKSAQPSPLSFLAKNSTRQLGNTNGASNANYSSYNSNRASSMYGSYRGQQSQVQQYAQQSAVAQRPSASLTYGGFQSYTGKVHVQGPSMRNYGQAQQSTTQAQNNRATTYTSSLPADCNIASADCYSASGSTKIASYASYASGQQSSSPLPY